MGVDKYEDMTIIFAPNADTLKTMGIYEKILACENSGEQYSAIQYQLRNIINDFGRLQSMGLTVNGRVDFDKLLSEPQPQNELPSGNLIEYINDFSKNLTDVIISRAGSEDNSMKPQKNSFGLTEYVFCGNVFEDKNDFESRASFDFEHRLVSLPLKDLSDDEKIKIDPDSKIIKNGCKLNLIIDSNMGLAQPEYKILISLQGENDRYYPLGTDAAISIYNSFKFEVSAYDKDADAYYLCGLSNNRKEAYNIAELAFASESCRTDTEREARGVPDIDRVFVFDTDTDKKLAFVDGKGFHLINSLNRDGQQLY